MITQIKIKAKILAAIRTFFEKEGFNERLFLTPSPEFFIKKLLSAGLKNIYQISKAYRDQQEKEKTLYTLGNLPF